MKWSLFKVLVVLALLSLVVAPVGAAPSGRGPVNPEDLKAVTDVREVPTVSRVVGEEKGATEPGRYIIELKDAPVSVYQGGVQGFAATANESGLDLNSPAAVAYTSYLEAKQVDLVQRMSADLGRPVETLFDYQVAFNGFSTVMTPEEAAETARIPGVVRVYRVQVEHPTTDAGPTWIGAPAVWETTVPADKATLGQGVLVGILDTGINSDHPSFAEVGPVDGYVHENPFGDGVFVGVCDPLDPSYDDTFECNNKLVGAYSYTTVGPNEGFTPEDYGGHGSHTASTVAGNYVLGTGDLPISGVAPHANIIAYDVCDETPPNGACYTDSSVAAVEQAIADGVDVINYSISGGEDPYNDPVELAFLNATHAGVVVNTSAGNEGPGPSTVAHRSPWVLSVAASTHNRAFFNSVVDLEGGSTTPPADILGRGYSDSLGLSPIVYAGDYGNPLCFMLSEGGSWAPGTDFTGQIVVCDRGTNARVDKARAVAEMGAAGFVLANNAGSGDSLVGDMYVIPGVHITYTDGVALKAWLDTGTGHKAAITGAVADLNPANGDVMADFSSRGPNTTFDVLKPDVSAPGVDIFAAVNTPDPANPGPAEFNFMSGTSMASPHSAGASALLVALQPDWTPAEIRSALMLTAKTTDLYKEDGTSPADVLDVGNGRIQVDKAALVGFVLDENKANFEAANPAIGGKPEELNLASLYESQCVGSCSWTRTLTSVAEIPVDYTVVVDAPADVVVTVTPESFTLPAGATQEVIISMDVSGMALDTWVFGAVHFETDTVFLEGKGDVSDAHFSFAALSSAGNLPTLVDIYATRDMGQVLLPDLTTIAMPEVTIQEMGLSAPSLYDFALPEDPNNGSAYDNLEDVFYTTVTVPAGTMRLVAEILASSAPDADLFLGFDVNNDGLPDELEQLASSTTGSWTEYISLLNPDPGTYWVIVQNWSSSAAAVDDFTLAVGVVDENEDNFFVAAPESVLPETLFDMTVVYGVDVPEGTRLYGAFSVGSSETTPGDVGMVAVDYLRGPDDVTKTVSDTSVAVGDTVTYTITVAPNMTADDVAYTLQDTLPVGLDYVVGSLQTEGSETAATYDAGTHTITWNGILPAMAPPTYAISTNIEDNLCDTPYGGYLDLGVYNIDPDPTIAGDTMAWTVGSSLDFDFYGQPYSGLTFTDDGFLAFAPDDLQGAQVWVNQALPDPTDPNALAAILWDDYEVVYNATNGSGVTIATDGPPVGDPVLYIIEYDDIQLYQSPEDTYDFEVIYWVGPAVDGPGQYEFYYAYDNLVGPTNSATVGVENADGSLGTTLLYDGTGTPVEDGLVVCFDLVASSTDPVVITFEAEVTSEGGAVITNTVTHDNDAFGTEPETAEASLVITAENTAPIVANAIPDQTAMEDSAFSFTFAANAFTDTDEGDVLSYSAEGLPAWLSFNPVTRTFSGTPRNEDVGFVDVEVTATDLGGLTASDTFRITVQNTNDAPVVNGSVALQRVEEFTAYSYTLPANTFTDVDAGDTLTCSVTGGKPAWLSFNASTWAFSGTPQHSDGGAFTVTVTCEDAAGASASLNVDFEVFFIEKLIYLPLLGK